ncbi:MAG: class I SAM-dependent methyltransferase [Candidatus Paceibacterota bacterium]|jgi:2-polyprenyl-3-methyl-5-hydroxy-6-metoxy-1,4-benzoquinol methylase
MAISSNLKNWLKETGFFTVKAPDDILIENIKNKFEHEKRSFFFGWKKHLVDSLYCHASPGVLEETLRLISDTAKASGDLLNLGGGTGQVSQIFKSLGHEVYNVDLALENTDEKNIRWDLNQKPYPFADQTFDFIVGQEIIEHLENPWEFFRQAKRILRPNGLFIISTPNILSTRSRLKFLLTGYFPWFTPDCFSYHINPVPYWQIELIARQTGWQIEKTLGNGDYFFPQKRKSLAKILSRNEEIIIALKPKQ